MAPELLEPRVSTDRPLLYIGRVRDMRKTQTLVHVAAVLMSDPRGKHWGYALSNESGVQSGALYPILHRMLNEGWLRDGWEDFSAAGGSRPPRRYYELTAEGSLQLSVLLEDARSEPRFKFLRTGNDDSAAAT